MALWPVAQGCVGLNVMVAIRTLRGQGEGQVLVPGIPGGAEMRPGSGLITAALGWNPGWQPSVWVIWVMSPLLPRDLGTPARAAAWMGPKTSEPWGSGYSPAGIGTC